MSTHDEEKHDKSEKEGNETAGARFPEELPPPDFSYIAQTFGVQALIHMGKLPTPGMESPEINLKLAKFNIDLLEILREKTQGNLSEQEKKILEEMLHVTRMAYVDANKEHGSSGEGE